jgi:plastocyanin
MDRSFALPRAARLGSVLASGLLAFAVAACGSAGAASFSFEAAPAATAGPTSTAASADDETSAAPAASGEPSGVAAGSFEATETAEPSGSPDDRGGSEGDSSGAVRAVTSSITTAPAPATAQVRIVDYAFTPASITIRAGGRVTWTNAGSDRHSISLATGESARLTTGQTFSTAFATAGRYVYACGLHPSMTGVVIVTDAASTTGSGAAATPTAPARPTADAAPSATASPDDRGNDKATASPDDHGNDKATASPTATDDHGNDGPTATATPTAAADDHGGRGNDYPAGHDAGDDHGGSASGSGKSGRDDGGADDRSGSNRGPG